jgi:alanyl-tRNA synthetase
LLTVLRRDDPSRTVSDLPVELVEHTVDHFRQSLGTGIVREVLLDEERRFGRLLERGRRVLSRPEFRGPLSEEDYHYLHDTHGLPRELVAGLLS